MNATDNFVTCPLTSLMSILGAKWTVEILRELAIEPVRTRRLLKLIDGLSMKCLQEKLRALNSIGVVETTTYEERPLRTEHRITERGNRLLQIFTELKALSSEIYSTQCSCPLETREGSGCPGRVHESHLPAIVETN